VVVGWWGVVVWWVGGLLGSVVLVGLGGWLLWSTHRLTSVVEMDEIIVISGGRAIERGSHAELLAKNGTYRRLWDDQIHQPHPALAQLDDEDSDEDDDDLDEDDDEDDDDEE
jgi:ATP-binding cassette subfamily B protein